MLWNSGLRRLLAAALLGALATCAWAQNYPSRPVRLIVDGPPGGVNDVWARRFAQRIGDALGQPVIVDNRPGASGSIAAEAVARAPGDGYTVLYGGFNPLVAYPAAGGVVRYDPLKDFTPVALATMGWPALIVNGALGVRTLPELLRRLQAKPDENICATAGVASVQHFACARFAQVAKRDLRMIPYKGGTPALVDTANGQAQVAVGFTVELEPFTGPGRVLPLAAFGPGRLKKFPDTPTFAELGLGDLEMIAFSGFFMPPGAPKAAVARFNAEVLRAVQDPQMQEWILAVGAVHQRLSPEEFAAMMSREVAKWKKLSETTGIRVE